jgi:hypothetical protein
MAYSRSAEPDLLGCGKLGQRPDTPAVLPDDGVTVLGKHVRGLEQLVLGAQGSARFVVRQRPRMRCYAQGSILKSATCPP